MLFLLVAHAIRLKLALSPDQAVLLATAGLGLLAWELNRPGLVLPGATGLTAFLYAVASLSRYPLRPIPLVLLVLCVMGLAANLLWKLPSFALAVLSLLLTAALTHLLPARSNPPLHPLVAVPCGLAVGLLASILSRIAVRARRAKQVN